MTNAVLSFLNGIRPVGYQQEDIVVDLETNDRALNFGCIRDTRQASVQSRVQSCFLLRMPLGI